MPRRMRRFAVRGDDKGLLQGRGATVHNARPNNRMPLELGGQSFQEGIALERMDRRCGRLHGGIFGIAKAERHGRYDEGGVAL